MGLPLKTQLDGVDQTAVCYHISKSWSAAVQVTPQDLAGDYAVMILADPANPKAACDKLGRLQDIVEASGMLLGDVRGAGACLRSRSPCLTAQMSC